MSRPDCDGDLVAFAVPELLESHTPEATLIVGLCADCLRLYSTEAPSSDGALRPLANALPDGDAGAAVTLLVGTFDSLALDRTDIVDCVEFVERSGTDMYLALDRLQQTATAPHLGVAHQ